MNFVDKAKDVAEDVGEKAKDLVETVGDKVSGVTRPAWDKVRDAAGNLGDKVSDVAAPTWEMVKDSTEKAAETVSHKMSEMAGEVKHKVFSSGADTATTATDGAEITDDSSGTDGAHSPAETAPRTPADVPPKGATPGP